MYTPVPKLMEESMSEMKKKKKKKNYKIKPAAVS